MFTTIGPLHIAGQLSAGWHSESGEIPEAIQRLNNLAGIRWREIFALIPDKPPSSRTSLVGAAWIFASHFDLSGFSNAEPTESKEIDQTAKPVHEALWDADKNTHNFCSTALPAIYMIKLCGSALYDGGLNTEAKKSAAEGLWFHAGREAKSRWDVSLHDLWRAGSWVSLTYLCLNYNSIMTMGGIGIGWYFGHGRPEGKTDSSIKKHVQDISFDTLRNVLVTYFFYQCARHLAPHESVFIFDTLSQGAAFGVGVAAGNWLVSDMGAFERAHGPKPAPIKPAEESDE